MTEGPHAVVRAFRRNVVVAASAGTGKTYLLTSLYVLSTLGLTAMGQRDRREAHPPVSPDQIVATTFSRAAALEIRTRVERALRAIAAEAPDAPFAPDIQARLAELADPPSPAEITARARRAVDAWSESRIDTLHGLAGDLLRRFALPLGLTPGLRVGEQDELAELARAAVDDVLGAALSGSADEIAAARALVDACGGIGRTNDIVMPFFDRLDEEGLDVDDLTTTDHLAVARSLRDRLARVARACAATARKEIADAAAALVPELASPGPAIPAAAQPLLDRLFEFRKPKTPNDAEIELFALRSEVQGTTHLARARALAATLAESPDLQARERGVLALLGRMARAMRAERTRRGVLGFGDLLRLARARLCDNPAVLREVRGEIDVLLVDEFQDSSRSQRDLIYLLRAERTEAGRIPAARDITPHGLFLVGDRKQSIYGFRGADVSVFTAMCAELAGESAGSALDIPRALWGDAPSADFVALRESRRSGVAIVDFVNAFSSADFAALAQEGAEVPMTYAEAEHLVPTSSAPPSRVVRVVDDGEPIDDPLLASEGGLREALVAAAAARALLREDGLRAKDVAILARRRATIPLVELALTRLGLPYVVAGRALYDTLEVRDLASLVRLVLDPRDRHALVQILRGPLVALSDSALVALCDARGLSPAVLEKGGPDLDRTRFAEEAGRLRDFRRRFLDSRPSLVRLGPEEALTGMFVAFDLDRIVAALPRADARLANLDRLVTIARARGGSLLGFSRWLDRQIADETDEAEAVVFSPDDDAVRVTTIHASKGLDFDAAIVLDLAAQPKPEGTALGIVRQGGGAPALVLSHRGRLGASLQNRAREEAKRQARERAAAERRRITYVALTRAKRHLVLVGTPGKPPNDSALSILESHAEGALAGKVETWESGHLLLRALEDAQRPVDRIAPAVDVPPVRLRLAREISLATTPLGVFRECPRRFSLRFLVGLDEPVASGQLELFEMVPSDERETAPDDEGNGDPRALGRAAHRLLERWPRERFGEDVPNEELVARLVSEGLAEAEAHRLAPDLATFLRSAYAKRLASPHLELHRESEVLLRLGGADEAGLVLRGTVDAYAFDPVEGTIDVFDYKLARRRPSLEAYAFQLRAYALALARRYPGAAVRTGVVFLLGGEIAWLDAEERPLSPAELTRIEADLLASAHAFAKARATGDYPGVEEARCRKLSCGFLTACHRSAGARPRGPAGRRASR